MALPTNRSIPPVTVIPVLAYADVHEAAAWLCRAFGFVERLRIGDHRVQLTVGDGAVVVTDGASSGDAPAPAGHSVMVRVPNANAHYEQAVRSGVRVGGGPVDYAFGERQYSADDLGGHRWTLTESIADVDPADWGGILLK